MDQRRVDLTFGSDLEHIIHRVSKKRPTFGLL